MNDLELYREQLALCDDKIIDALVERSMIIEKIMAYKEEYGMPILQPGQEAKQKRRLEEKLSDNRYKDEICDISIVSARTASGFKQENCLITILYSLVLWAQANLRSQII